MILVKKNRINEFSLLFGVLCFAVVYMHSSAIAGYFDIYALWSGSKLTKTVVHCIFSTVVVDFFILWGYLSNKYIYDELPAVDFFWSKLLQFYPLYLANVVLIFSKSLLNGNVEKFYPWWQSGAAAFGLYVGYFFGAHVFVPVIFSIITITFIKKVGGKGHFISVYLLTLLILIVLLPNKSQLGYVKYFGYYVGFIVGVKLKDINFFESNTKSGLKKYVILISSLFMIMSLFSSYKGWNVLPISIQPSSLMHIILSVFILFISFEFSHKVIMVYSDNIFIRSICIVGNYAYEHLIIHFHVMNIIVTVGFLLHVNQLYIQIFLILFTSYITIFIISPVWHYLYANIFRLVAGKASA